MATLKKQLGTSKIKEQEAIVEQLLEDVNSEIIGLTILITNGGRISLSVIGQPEPGLLIQTLEVVRDDLVKQSAIQEIAQQTKEVEQEFESGE